MVRPETDTVSAGSRALRCQAPICFIARRTRALGSRRRRANVGAAMSWPGANISAAIVLVLSGTAAQALDAIGRPSPACPATSPVCVGLRLHLATQADGTSFTHTPEWLAGQIAEANRHFAGVGVGFEVAETARLGPNEGTVVTRADRDRLGRGRWRRGAISVFIVQRLMDVDAPGERQGVHWRDRKDAARRWIIVAAEATDWVLAHELGHYFSLPHSRYADSIMNKTPRLAPPVSTWSFAKPEQHLLRRSLRQMLSTRELVATRAKRETRSAHRQK